jgi:hypothetical protein
MSLSKQALVICAVSLGLGAGLLLVRGLPRASAGPEALGMCSPAPAGQNPASLRCQPELGVHVGGADQSGPCPLCPSEGTP